MGVEFNKCCFCIELRTGCLIIGYLNLISYIFLILKLILVLAAAGGAKANADINEFQDAKVDVQTLEAFMFFVIVAMFVFAVLFLTFNIVLLVGLHQNKRGHVRAYVIFTRIIIILSIIQLFCMFDEAVIAVILLVNILVTIYFYLVIQSYHLKMDDSANKPAIYNTA